MGIELTIELAKFVSGVQYKDLPEEAIPLIRTAFADTIGVMIAGSHEEAPQVLKSTIRPEGKEATLLFGSDRASVLDAALINATAAHTLDYDDVAHRGHPSVVLVPAILAEAEVLAATGEQMATAYTVGYETWAELARRDPDHQHKKGWHPTGIFGAIGAAAACASLHKLDWKKTAFAISLGATQSSGLIANFGTMAKPFHAGRAAQAGVLSARLAKNGFTAALDALEHPPGFLAAVSVNNKFDVDSPVQAGRSWSLPKDRYSVKKYPVCFAAHPAIDAVIDLLGVHQLDAEKIQSIAVKINERHLMVLRNHSPQTGLEAKFSLEFAMACPAVTGNVGLREITDDFVKRPDVQNLMKRVKLSPTKEDPNRPGYGVGDQITITTTSGATLKSNYLTQVRGAPDSPLGEEDLWKKFEDCIQCGNADVDARKLFTLLMTLDRLENVRELYSARRS